MTPNATESSRWTALPSATAAPVGNPAVNASGPISSPAAKSNGYIG